MKLGEKNPITIGALKGFNIYILKMFNPLRVGVALCPFSPSSASSTGGYSNLTTLWYKNSFSAIPMYEAVIKE